MKKLGKKILPCLFLLISCLCKAQGPPPPQPPPPVGLPIDNALILLLAAGLLYGAYKALKLKKT